MLETCIRRAFAAITLILVILSPACRRNTPLNLKTPAQRVAVYNGTLAESVRAVTTGAIALQKSGVLTRPQVLQVLDYAERVAAASRAVAVIQQTPGDWIELAPQIRAVLSSISPPGNLAAGLAEPSGESKELAATLDSIQSTITILLREVSK